MNYYCATDGGFYSLAFHGSIPEGAVAVSFEDYALLMEGQEQGKTITRGANGYPILTDPPMPSPEVMAGMERAWRDARLAETDAVVSRHRDEIEEGGSTTLTAVQYTELQAYRRRLRDWPEDALFPSVNHRPSPPQWLAGHTQ
ncbi:phage tail assembly chaperone [Pseudomonas fluorescens]|uniref:phage tail assembly chaperone n=1 Tax=Pseudomonas fluorescens TaxID=294 RepID=UPI00209B6D9B|nr:phage tail assembly chaperone [Pseudomonas fluorescens]MCO7626408.1 phage tail assembly chaperone [Pseudomonas fluorescens]